jgi:DNA-binding NtrC family response regulator
VPKLSERQEDIVPLAERFISDYAAVVRLAPLPLSEEVRACFRAAPWPGNVRELQKTCHYALVHAFPDEMIRVDHLPVEFLATLSGAHRPRVRGAPSSEIQDALRRTGGNKTKAARLLGVTRQQLYRRLENEEQAS